MNDTQDEQQITYRDVAGQICTLIHECNHYQHDRIQLPENTFQRIITPRAMLSGVQAINGIRAIAQNPLKTHAGGAYTLWAMLAQQGVCVSWLFQPLGHHKYSAMRDPIANTACGIINGVYYPNMWSYLEAAQDNTG